MSTIDQQAKAPQPHRTVVSFLRSSKSGLKNRTGVLNGKRIDYFKGKSAIKALLSPAYAKLKGVPKVTSESEAQNLLHQIIPYAFYLRVDRGQPVGSASSPKHLQVNPMQLFKPDEYFAWFYDGPQWTTYLGGAVMVAVILAGVMFPLWPPIMRLGVWYLSIAVLGLIGLLLAIAVVRLIFYIITVLVASPGIWIFPRLFADVGFVDSFIPLWEWDMPKKKSKKKRSDKVKGEAEAPQGAFGEEVLDSGNSEGSRPTSRGPTVEEVPDDE
ncbi:translocation protein Sec62-domain-containing protein [Amylostereum chailletii]|nr:translocation protein Sec62-domain-containing protein [Amylostereum chailletii]